ncbi:HlyD family secretion protein [Oceanibium sediminis]|uniref:HlyD family secretion protein n=1 Tax=Oceanibium sediminis TaxID=2026339 RepID=UPI000DD2F681|nr:HlyD family secretion protein [Oceanibium sediminis]
MSENTPQTEPGASSAKGVAIGVVVLLVILVVLYALTDRLTPASSRGVVSAQVVQIAPRVSGEITAVHVEDDAVVAAGDPLFSIDTRPYELAVRRAEANLEQAVQNIDASSASLVAAQAAVTQARTALENTRAEAERTFRLEERGIASPAQGDQARASVAQAEAGLESAQANLDSARAQLGSGGADNPAITAAEAQLEQAQYDLASTTVTAPHLGVVTNVTLSEGQFVGAGNPALTFIDAEAAWITVDLRENQLQGIDPGDPARLLFDAVPGRIFEGRVQSIAWGIAPGRNEQGGLVVNQPANRWFEPARRIPVRIELDGGMEAWPRAVRVGGKVHAVVFADGDTSGPIAYLARGIQRLRSWASYLH